MNRNKKLRRLKHLCYNRNPPYSGYMFYDPQFRLPSIDEWLAKDYLDSEYREIFTLLKELFPSEREAFNFWSSYVRLRHANRAEWRKKPIQSKQDNKNQKVGSGHSWGNKIRFPKKVRKTAWKRFYKLFPEWKEIHELFGGKKKENKL